MSGRFTTAYWLGKATSFGCFYGGLSYAGIIGAPVLGTIIGSLLGVGCATSLSAAAYEKFIHNNNNGTIDHFVDSFHQNTFQYLQSAFMMIPIIAQCCHL
jgi:hypothetical protein